MLVRIGSRGSRLALTQAELAASVLRRGGHEIAFVPITTAGDRDRSSPFGQIGERGVFVKEIEEALLAGRIDVAVHSAKDLTATDPEGLTIGAGCLAPVAAHHDGATLHALIADEDGAWVERRTGDDPVALAHELVALAR